MKANELRLGNIVRVNNLRYYPKLKDINTEVTGIRKGIKGFFLNLNHSCEHYEYDINQLMDFIEPVKLTTEILYKLGFSDYINEDGDVMFKFNDFEIEFMNLIESDFYFNAGLFEETKIPFLHNLQNLFFDLTGKELILKL